MEINSITTKPSPPAGTKTHKPDCGCIQCKANRYDALHDKWAISQLQLTHAQGELKAAKDLQDRTAVELGAAMTEADELRAALKLANASLESLKTTNRVFEANTKAAYQNAMERERHAGWVETWVSVGVSALIFGVAAFLVGRFGR